ncbi:MAG: hypothetical protein N2651_00745 [Fimbriimonadales bacterium]|nr:hypothetical protein [Fimbriimonadales bacterium]
METAIQWRERLLDAREQGGQAMVNAPTGSVAELVDAYHALEDAYHELWRCDFPTSWQTRERVECAYHELRRELAYLALRQAFAGLPACLGRILDEATRVGSRDPQDPVLVGALYHALHDTLWEARAR